MAAIVGFAHQIAAERDADVLLDKVCAAAREVTLAQHAIITMLTPGQIGVPTDGDERHRRRPARGGWPR